MATTLHILIGNHNVVDWLNVLALFVGQRLGIDFYVSRAKFLTTLRSHLDIACSCFFYPIHLMWILAIVSYIYYHSCSLKFYWKKYS